MLSAIIITKNEEKNISRCLFSIQGLVDEIVVVDTGSADRTLEIVGRYTDKIFSQRWEEDFAKHKNYAIFQSKGDWILSLDADEEISSELNTEIKNFFASGKEKKYAGMWIPRKNIIFGKWLKHGENWPDYQLKIFRRGSCFQRAVHELVVVNGPRGFFTQPIIHHSYNNIKSFIQRSQNYTDIEAKILKQEQEKSSFKKVFVYPVAKFLKVYIFKKGFLDGWRGLIYAGLLAYYSFLKRLKHYQINKKS
ncbi:MAG: glycosyltransferase family 2 protein [Patescibacteria group bacterium]|nr:glycosyltransferase family 2 protein [Patescibacteria group bacterium]